jgi:energy-coupling factor transporter ATP-binding protein EcfA2
MQYHLIVIDEPTHEQAAIRMRSVTNNLAGQGWRLTGNLIVSQYTIRKWLLHYDRVVLMREMVKREGNGTKN